MSITTPHREYVAQQYTWQALLDAYVGSGNVKTAVALSGRSARDGVKSAGTRYLPRPAGMKRQAQYDAYRDRAVWLGATERAVHGLTGSVFRKRPEVIGPERLLAQCADVTLTGVPLASFAEMVMRETLLMGRYGILVDFPKPETTADGVEIPPPVGSRPYWIAYTAMDIWNWRTTQRNGVALLSLLVIRECIEEPMGLYPEPGYFTMQSRTQYRVLRLNEVGFYEVSLWRDAGSGTVPGHNAAPVLIDAWVPRREGAPMTFIPFVFFAPFSLELTIEKSLLEAMVEINYQYYRHSADYEHALHLTALPTPWITGHRSDSTTFEIGSATAWMIPEPDARVGMLAIASDALGPFEHAMAADVQNMAALGARLLEGQPLVPETATAIRDRTQSAQSPVQSLITTVSMGLTKALQYHAWWAGIVETPDDPDVRVTLNNDLVSVGMEPLMLTALMSAFLQGGISYETLYDNLRKGELTRPGIDASDEQALIALRRDAQAFTVSNTGV